MQQFEQNLFTLVLGHHLLVCPLSKLFIIGDLNNILQFRQWTNILGLFADLETYQNITHLVLTKWCVGYIVIKHVTCKNRLYTRFIYQILQIFIVV